MVTTLQISVIVIYWIQIIIDPTLIECKSVLGVILIMLHHALQLSFFFGSLMYGYHEYHLVLVIVSLLVHIKLKRCPITVVHNKLCGFETNNPLVTLINRIVPNYPDNDKQTVYVYYLMLIGVILYDFISIYKKNV
jgi:hypothetical protein